ncbi:MAG: translational GTPase TypA [Candidatus Latescibacteria bacterium]|jgi:GTP-binding protein|nr:translational GTPase TypA [Gemmatimonadaceae bacterium]MDP6017310.1 translational GTPase TypA [Candidatus Latescibacterota bacterium]MDP7448973.1 translational GTPase TypA [Candidatus Latescibacterota bacterium]HJP32224.1 translational GTPase TypA [Candidatus Latescibacterota bacterium]
MTADNIRNIAIIAHVDHGKTTLVDGMLRQTHVFHDNQAVVDRVLDSNDLERERGITITAKNTAILYGDTTINLVDTPGHADFGSEVERILNMVDGVLLLVDAVEGPMPQTRFVLRHALRQGLKAILVVNKIDRPAARPDWVTEQTLDLFLELDASDEQCDFPILFTRALEGRAGHDHEALADDLGPLFDTILESVPPPEVDPDAPPQLLVTTLQYSNYVGKIAVGRLLSGELRPGQAVAHIDRDGTIHSSRIREVYTFRNLEREAQDVVRAGSIVALSGIENIGIGDTITDIEDPRALPRIEVEQPTVRMTFAINTSPFAGRDGRFLTSRQIRDRLHRELEQNVALRVEDAEVTGQWLVSGRGELHLAILIETMRREGYEFAVSQPEVIYHEGDNGLEEPFEEVYVEVPSGNLGAVSEMLGRRRGRLTDMRHTDGGIVHCTYVVPTRGMLGFRNPFLTSTRGNGIYHTLFHEYAPFAGAIDTQDFGSLVSGDTGVASAYSLTNLKQRGTFFIPPGTEVYDGQVIGEHIRSGDLTVNPTKRKPGTGHRAAPTGDDEQLPPHRILSLDDAIEYLNADELMEVTPGSLRLRKKELQSHLRERVARQAKFAAA